MSEASAHNTQLNHVFSLEGPLANTINGYSEREDQVKMAMAIENAIANNKQLIAEAGTGTGKTFAYLVPALLSGGKVIISTGTKTLQDQLFNRDLPNVRDALKVPVTVSMLKGRANYVCHYHLEKASQEGRFASRDDAKYIHLIKNFAENSKTGDKSRVDRSARKRNRLAKCHSARVKIAWGRIAIFIKIAL